MLYEAGASWDGRSSAWKKQAFLELPRKARPRYHKVAESLLSCCSKKLLYTAKYCQFKNPRAL